MDKIGFCNTKSLNNPRKHVDVKSFMRNNQIGLLCGLLEKRLKGCNFSKVFSSAYNGWSIVANYTYHRGGRIWVIWMPSKFISNIIDCHAQYIHCKACHLASGKKFNITFVYGLNNANEIYQFWDGHKGVCSKVQSPCAIGRYFNIVLNLNERLGSTMTLNEVIKFRKCIRDCGVSEHKSSGPFFTWCNEQDGVDRFFPRLKEFWKKKSGMKCLRMSRLCF